MSVQLPPTLTSLQKVAALSDAKAEKDFNDIVQEAILFLELSLCSNSRTQFLSLNGFHRDHYGSFPVNLLSHKGGISCGADIKPDAPEMENAEYLLDGEGRPAAVIVHVSAAKAENIACEFAAKLEIGFHIPPVPTTSWHGPGYLVMVVYTELSRSIAWPPQHSVAVGD